MKKFSLLCFLLSLNFLPFSVNAQSKSTLITSVPQEWIGEYHYSFSERGGSGYTDVTEYIMTISKGDDGSGCHFVVQGPQLSNADYECRAEAKGDKLSFYFVKSLEPMGDGQIKRMKSGYLIGSLIKVTARGKTRYRLESGRYQFVMVSTMTHPAYFKKTN